VTHCQIQFLNACIAEDPESRIACEAVAKSIIILIQREITTTAKLNIEQFFRDRIKKVCMMMKRKD
jgi:S-adenosylmethionine synthetase